MLIDLSADFITTALPPIYNSSDCQDVNNYNDTFQQCQFVLNNADCQDNDGLISYIKLTYCTLQNKCQAVIILSIWLVVLFTGLGVTADDFLCPALVVISRTLRLSHNVAGVTFLAFGNGAPDIFSSIAAIQQTKPEMVIGELFGAGIFVTTVVAGSVLISSNFKAMGRPLIRDIMFYMVATFLAWLIFYRGRIDIAYTIGFICIYLVYIVVVVGSGIIYTKFIRNKTKEPSNEPPKEVSERVKKLVFQRTFWRQASRARRPSFPEDDDDEDGVVLRRFNFRDALVTSPQRRRTLSNIKFVTHHPSRPSVLTIGETMERIDRKMTISDTNFPERSEVPKPPRPLLSQISQMSLLSNESRKMFMSQWKEFLIHICPLDYQSWKKDPWYLKIFAIFKAPIYFLLTVTIPVVDRESDKHNWCKLLNIFHLIISPQTIIFITEMSPREYKWLPELIVLGVSLVLAVVVFKTSKFEEPPKYHWVFAYLGFVASVSWIYALANEVVDLLQAIGIIFSLSSLILGLTVLAWGNSLGDFVSDLTMARNGFPRMGISACFGGPVLNLLLGIGAPFTVMFAKGEKKSVPVKYNQMITLLYATISISLGSTLLILIFNRFQSSKWHGIYLICIFFTFITFACFIEWGVI